MSAGQYAFNSPLSPRLSPATPADVGLLMQLGVDGVFVGSGIFKSSEPKKRAKAMVQAVTHFNDPQILAKVSAGLGEAMVSNLTSVPLHRRTKYSV